MSLRAGSLSKRAPAARPGAPGKRSQNSRWERSHGGPAATSLTQKLAPEDCRHCSHTFAHQIMRVGDFVGPPPLNESRHVPNERPKLRGRLKNRIGIVAQSVPAVGTPGILPGLAETRGQTPGETPGLPTGKMPVLPRASRFFRHPRIVTTKALRDGVHHHPLQRSAPRIMQ